MKISTSTYEFDVVTLFAIKLECIRELTKFLLKRHEAGPYLGLLNILLSTITNLDKIFYQKHFLIHFCGFFKYPKDQIHEDLVNIYQKKFVYPWMTQFPYSKIKIPFLPKLKFPISSTKSVAETLRESIDKMTLEFLKPNTNSKMAEWKSNCKESLNKYARPVFESMIISHLMAKFGIQFINFESIRLFFNTEMPAISKLMTTHIHVLISELYINFPYYKFELKVKVNGQN